MWKKKLVYFTISRAFLSLRRAYYVTLSTYTREGTEELLNGLP